MPQKEKGSANNYSWARSVLKSQNIKKSTVKDQFKVFFVSFALFVMDGTRRADMT